MCGLYCTFKIDVVLLKTGGFQILFTLKTKTKNLHLNPKNKTINRSVAGPVGSSKQRKEQEVRTHFTLNYIINCFTQIVM